MKSEIVTNRHGLRGFGITVLNFAAWLFSFIFGYTAIGIWGQSYAKRASGYEVGNRYRLMSVFRLELIMMYLSVVIYLHLFSYFHPVQKYGKKLRSPMELVQLRKKCLTLFVAILVGAHLTYFYYFLSFEVPYVIFWLSALGLGIWMHLLFFSIFFMAGNALVSLLNLIKMGREFVALLCRVGMFKQLITNRKVQVMTTVGCTIVLSLVQWYSSDKVVVKTMELKLNNYPETADPMTFALITDLHGGGMVYESQIADVVDKTNNIESLYGKRLDAVFIAGDAIDAPKELIEQRMQPLKHLKSRLGTFYVSGNHEFYYGDYNEWKQLFIQYGIRVLENEIEHIDDAVCLVGLHDLSSYKAGIINVSMDESAISKCQKNESVVVLAHNPAATKRIMEFANISGRHVDLILSGHTHGGQYYILVPYVYWFLPYLYGLYDVQLGTTQLFVSAGTLYQAAPMKMMGKSEIWLITIS